MKADDSRGITASTAPYPFDLPDELTRSAGHAPPRRPGSVRRTSTIDVTWPEGRFVGMLLDGRARDIVTPATGGAPVVEAEDRFTAFLDDARTITSIATVPLRARDQALVGHRGGGHLRRTLAETMPGEIARGTPLYLILDDISGTSLVAGWIWSVWTEDWMRTADRNFDKAAFTKIMAQKVGICSGFVAGGNAARMGGDHRPSRGWPTVDLRNPADPEGWHDTAPQTGIAMRRARRIDVWRDGDAILVDAAFQDSGVTPTGERAALHEYSLSMRASAASLLIEAIAATPRVLPYPECPTATLFLKRLIGTPVSALRRTVLEKLHGTAGCTHLNDAVRSLAEVPQLLELL